MHELQFCNSCVCENKKVVFISENIYISTYIEEQISTAFNQSLLRRYIKHITSNASSSIGIKSIVNVH